MKKYINDMVEYERITGASRFLGLIYAGTIQINISAVLGKDKTTVKEVVNGVLSIQLPEEHIVLPWEDMRQVFDAADLLGLACLMTRDEDGDLLVALKEK